MVAVGAAEHEVRWLLRPGVDLAVVNGPRSVVLSGDRAAVEEAAAALRARGRRTRALRVSHAFHSVRMEPVLADFERVAASLTYAKPAWPIVSTRTGRPATAGVAPTGHPHCRVRRTRPARTRPAAGTTVGIPRPAGHRGVAAKR